jgi:hypothetical protein
LLLLNSSKLQSLILFDNPAREQHFLEGGALLRRRFKELLNLSEETYPFS